MSNIITIGYSTEGNTDKRFLESIIKKTFEEVAFLCNGIIEVYDPVFLPFPKENGFIEGVKELSKKAYGTGIFVLCIHADADSEKDENAYNYKINPGIAALQKTTAIGFCKNVVAIVPVQMTEAWILSNKDILKEEVNTSLSDKDLGLDRITENIANPKQVIENAIKIAQEHLPQRRKRLTLNDIYQPVGQKLNISDLEKLESFRKFKDGVKTAFKQLNYLT